MLDLDHLGDGQETQLRVASAKFRDRIARLEHQRTEIDSVLEELRRASEQVERMLADREDGKPSDASRGSA